MSTAIEVRQDGLLVPSPPVDGTPRSADRRSDKSALIRSESEKNLPDIRKSQTEIDQSKPLPTSLQSDFIPEEVLFALTHPPPLKDQLGPPTRHRNLNTTSIQTRNRPANVWNFKRKDKFKHLLENTPCLCGAGKDISFLYDVPLPEVKPTRPDTIDKSVVRHEVDAKPKQALQLPDTLVPEEYHVVKNKGVMGLEYHDDKYATQPEDHEKHLVMFPSMKPASRYEVVKLQEAFEQLLEKSGVNDLDVEFKGPTQMHNLLEIIKKEQNIYNSVFHELIRQVTVECAERGGLLATLRKKYSELINKIPQQIKSLHEEVMAQRALDRRLTEELMRFKTTIGILTSELSEVKEHDRRVTKEAQQAQEDLKQALSEAQKNASLLSEYHDLYELQRKRLEAQVFMLSDEKELWSTAAYCLALKVTEEAELTTAKRLHVSEKAWVKLAQHFTILLTDKDTELLTNIHGHVEKWRDLIDDFTVSLKQREEDMKTNLGLIKSGMQGWLKDLQKICFSSEGHFQKPPDKMQSESLLSDIKEWEEILGREAEKFGGDTLLSCQDQIFKIRSEMDGWTDNSLQVFSRHKKNGRTHPEQDSMMTVNELVEGLLGQFYNRLTGENGVATNVIHITNSLESWDVKISGFLNGNANITESEWCSFIHLLDDWEACVIESIEIDITETVRKVQKWMTSSSNSIDSEDAKLVEQVSTLHSEMVRWMVQILLRLAPDKEENSKEASEMALIGSASEHQLQANAVSLFERLDAFSKYVSHEVVEEMHRLQDQQIRDMCKTKGLFSMCCSGVVMDNTQQRRDNMEENAEHELRDLQRLSVECKEWVHTAKLLMSQLTGESVEKLFPPKPGEKLEEKTPTPTIGYVYHDEEKLEQPTETTEVKEKPSEEKLPEADSAEKIEVTPVAEDEPSVEEEPEEQLEEKSEEKHVTIMEPQKSDLALGEENVEIIGGDDNTHVRNLDRTAAVISPEDSDLQEGANQSDALKALTSLQEQLIATEERAQAAEEAAVTAEAELSEAHETIRALEKKLAAMGDDGSKDETKSEKSEGRENKTPSQSSKSPRQSSTSEKKSSPQAKATKASGKPKKR